MATVQPALPDPTALYEQHVDAVYGFLGRMGARGADQEDLVHDVFVTALTRFGTFDPSQELRPWLFGIGFRIAVAHHRRGHVRREVPSDELPELADEGLSLTDGIAQREARELLAKALAKLPEERRAALILHDLQGLTAAEIAAALEVPIPTVYSRLRVGREELTAAVRRLSPAGGEA